YAYQYTFKEGEPGKLKLEFYITPFDHADARGAYWFYCATDLAMTRTWNGFVGFTKSFGEKVSLDASLAAELYHSAILFSSRSRTVVLYRRTECPVSKGSRFH
ncbi:hypothetical protein D0T87_24385, partial [Bacteroides sp. 51]|nr:hypothetical protein [Bacteroides sp. 51]